MNVYVISPEGKMTVEKLGMNPAAGESPMVVVPQGAIFAAENIQPDDFTFVSCVTVPKFRYSGFRLVSYRELEKYGAEQRLCIK